MTHALLRSFAWRKREERDLRSLSVPLKTFEGLQKPFETFFFFSNSLAITCHNLRKLWRYHLETLISP